MFVAQLERHLFIWNCVVSFVQSLQKVIINNMKLVVPRRSQLYGLSWHQRHHKFLLGITIRYNYATPCKTIQYNNNRHSQQWLGKKWEEGVSEIPSQYRVCVGCCVHGSRKQDPSQVRTVHPCFDLAKAQEHHLLPQHADPCQNFADVAVSERLSLRVTRVLQFATDLAMVGTPPPRIFCRTI